MFMYTAKSKIRNEQKTGDHKKLQKSYSDKNFVVKKNGLLMANDIKKKSPVIPEEGFNSSSLLIPSSPTKVSPKPISSPQHLSPPSSPVTIDDKNDPLRLTVDEMMSEYIFPLLVLNKTDTLLPIKESVKQLMGDAYKEEIHFKQPYTWVQSIYETKTQNDPKFNLSIDEHFAIYIYTHEPDSHTVSIYHKLNATLTSIDRKTTLSPMKSYIHYLFSGLKKIPPWKITGDLYRGVALDLVNDFPLKYKENKVITWYACTSTSTRISAALTFLKDKKVGTLFLIRNCYSGRDIGNISSQPHENEVLFPPGSRFLIISINLLDNIKLIQMEQTKSIEAINMGFEEETQISK